tara:strand:+ start:1756 stop:3552 length:1797 start_codon:yes stop_codon:yes gene_type:complete
MSSYIISPFLSLITSILLFLGCCEIGKIIILKFRLTETIKTASIVEFQYPTFGIIIIALLGFPLVAFTHLAETILKLLAYILIICGLNFLYYSRNIYLKVKFKNKEISFYIYLIILILYFLLALSPLTAADVLDYHAGVALNILRFNQYILLPEWFTGLQAGHGEVLIALGFVVGAEQFGSLVQFSSLLTVSGIIISFCKKKNLDKSKFFLILTVFSCPILIFLLSGNKPQIFYSSLLFLSLAFNFTKFRSKTIDFKIYLIINILICICVMGKFSFNLTGALIWIYSTFNYLKRNDIKIIVIPAAVFILLFFPFIYWKFANLEGEIINYFFSPFPLHMPGYETFLSHNRGSQEIPFPNFLFYTSLSRITEFLALNSIFFITLLFFTKKIHEIRIILLLSSIFVIVSNIYASPSARYYLDVVLWLTLGVIFTNNNNLIKYLKILFIPQILIVLLILIYSVYNFFPGSIITTEYERVKNKYAYLYSGFLWLNENVPNNSKILIINRPISQYKDFAVSGNFNYFTNKNESIYYKKLISKYNLEFIAYLGNQPDLMHLKGCTNGIYKQENNIGYHATRNPFNSGSSYNGYIYYFDKNKLPNC